MRRNNDILAVVFLLLFFIVGGVLLGGHRDSKSRLPGAEETPDPSVYNDRASGSRAFFEWVKQEGYSPRVWRKSWDAFPSSAAILIVIDPQVESNFATLTSYPTGSSKDEQAQRDNSRLQAGDWPKLQRWLAAGHTAILMSSRLPTGRSEGESDGADTFADTADLSVESAENSTNREFGPAQPTPDTYGVLSIHSEAQARIHRHVPDAVALFGDSQGPVVLSLTVGGGRLYAISDSMFASNQNLAKSENALFLANVLRRSGHPGDQVLFDEYHHGDIDVDTGATVWNVLGAPIQLGLLQLVIAALALASVLGVRFGNSVPLLRGATRTSAEYVSSIAALYRRAHASNAALETLYRQFLRDLCLRLGLAQDSNLEQLAESASRRGHTDRIKLRVLLATCERRLDEGRISENELLELVREMARVRKDIGIA